MQEAAWWHLALEPPKLSFKFWLHYLTAVQSQFPSTKSCDSDFYVTGLLWEANELIYVKMSNIVPNTK